MKKFLSVIVMLLTLTLMMSTVAFAANGTDDSVVYNGRSFKVSELSQETIDWLEWYNGLSDDLKEMFDVVIQLGAILAVVVIY